MTPPLTAAEKEQLRALTNDPAWLRTMLLQFGRHDPFCLKDVPFSDGKCSCGWDDVVAALAGQSAGELGKE